MTVAPPIAKAPNLCTCYIVPYAFVDGGYFITLVQVTYITSMGNSPRPQLALPSIIDENKYLSFSKSNHLSPWTSVPTLQDTDYITQVLISNWLTHADFWITYW